ncbi:hypothetical protein FRC03_011737 [Tulasnella sp. 419]|nr:hypothetical protein FRC03_011737 [Tulasnella sp. 419]
MEKANQPGNPDDDVVMQDNDTSGPARPSGSNNPAPRATSPDDEDDDADDESELLEEVQEQLDNATSVIEQAHRELKTLRAKIPNPEIRAPEDEPVGYFAHLRRRRQKGHARRSRGAANNKLLEDIHAFSYLLLGVTSQKPGPGIRRKWTALPMGPPNPDEAPIPDNVNEFTLAWNRPITHRYNIAAIRNFTVAMIQSDDYPYGADMYAEIRKKWNRWFKTLRNKYEQETRPQSEMEVFSRRQESSAYGRRIRLFYARRQTLSSSRSLFRYLGIIDALGIDGMSSDEEVENDE